MDAVRKIIGLVLIVFFGLPILFGMIWAVGLIKATVTPEFLTDLPRQVIAEVPAAADAIFRDAQSEDFISDANTRAWFQAASKAGMLPSELMAKTGLNDWLTGELSGSLRQAGRVLRGEARPRPIVINLQPLKQALLSPEVERYLEATLNNLPPCDEQGLKSWGEVAAFGPRHRELPACRPDPEASKAALAAARAKVVGDIPDDFQVFRGVRHFPVFPLGLSRAMTVLSFFLLLIPAAFIFLGAVIADSTPAGFLRWSGASIFIGGFPALLLSLAVKYFSLWGLASGGFSWHGQRTSEFSDLVFDRLRNVPESVINQLFSPVIVVAALVCAAGIVLFAVSYSVRKTPRSARKPASTVPQAPTSPGAGAQGPGAPPANPAK
ncbi:MAG: hypothetical protein A2W03_15330 [Candidatus Aminicenantes bacterium RBG_16_63_16]|nr:MAG: hypothetical protein A2W03_15330 [Candidatus Aminicenantes bacterium RBG_16_63_16]